MSLDWLPFVGRESTPLCDNERSTCRLGAALECEDDCEEAVQGLIFPFLAISIGLVLQPISKRFSLPYTPLLILVGALLAVLGCSVDMGLLTGSLRAWVHISPPSLFFYVFLAPLVFESAFNADTHLFVKSIKQILFLAFFLVAVQCFLVAAFQLVVIRSPEWNLFSALVFGAMLSATDPISVSTTLKEVGASEALNTVIEGESLLNDGTAVVFYEAFSEAFVLGEASAGRIITQLVRLSLGGMAMGLAFGFAAVIFLSYVYELFQVEVSITLVVAFLGFWTAQSPAVLSGVICNVTSGIVLGAYGKQLISPSVRDPLRRFWELLSWIANTIVFVYAGLVVVAYIWTCSGDPLRWYDYLHILSWYVFMNAIRFLLIMLFHPVMKWGQPWYTWKHALVLSYSGLRGAVTLILALEIGDGRDFPVNVRSRIVVWSASFVALTLLVNGTTAKRLLHVLKLDKQDPIKQEFLWRARATMLTTTYEILDSITVHSDFKGCSWSVAAQAIVPKDWAHDINRVSRAFAASIDMNRRTSVMSTYAGTGGDRLSRRYSFATNTDARYSLSRASVDQALIQHRAPSYLDTGSNLETGSRESMGMDIDYRIVKGSAIRDADQSSVASDALGDIHDAAHNCPREIGGERDVEVRRRMLMAFLSTIREGYETSLLNYFHLTAITDDIKAALDANEEGESYSLLNFFDEEPALLPGRLDKAMTWLFKGHKSGPLGHIIKKQRVKSRIAFATIVSSAIKHVLCESFLKESPLVSQEVMTVYELALGYLNRLEALAPEEYIRVQTTCVVRYVFERQMHSLDDLRIQGVIDSEEADTIRSEIVDLQRQFILHTSKKRKVKETEETVLRNFPLFRPLDSESFKTSVVDRGRFLRIRSSGAYQAKPGSLIVVLRGALRINDLPFLIKRPSSISETTAAVHPEATAQDASIPMEGAQEAGGSSGDEKEEPTVKLPASQHLCFAKFSAIAPTDILLGHLSPLPVVNACEVNGDCTVFVLPGTHVRELAHSYEWFRTELARNIAKLVTLGFLQDSMLDHQLPEVRENLDPQDSEATPMEVAASVLELLPYSSLVGLTEKHGTAKVQGPGVLLQGRLNVIRKDLTSFLRDEQHTWSTVYEAPDILPTGPLSVELMPSQGSEEIELAEMMIQDIASYDVIAESRIRRWNGPPHQVDANGRFGLNRHMDLKSFLKQHEVVSKMPQEEVVQEL